MNRASTPTSTPLSTSPVRTSFYKPKDKVTISIGDHVSRSPIVAHEGKSLSTRKKRDNWLMKEDALLDHLVKGYPRGHPHWKGIADNLNSTLGSSRTGKQCRERWRNHLRPNIKKGGWTFQEEQMIHQMYKTFGPKWTVMTQYLKNRTDNDIKNKWYSMYRSASMQKQKNRDASQQLNDATKETCSQGNEGTNHCATWTTQPDGSATFPPPFSLTPITRKPETNRLNPAPSDDSERRTKAMIPFSCSWSDLSF